MKKLITTIQIYTAILFILLIYITFAHELAEAFILAIGCLIACLYAQVEKGDLK